MGGSKSYKLRDKSSQYSTGTFRIIAVGLLVIGLTVAGFISLHRTHTDGPIPQTIKRQVAFVIFYPSPKTAVVVDVNSFKYDTKEKLLSYVVNYANTPITIAEQATPQNFIDIPQAYDKLIESLGEYGSFQSYYDKVSLTHPKEFNGQQSAVMNSKGTLVFAHPTKGDLTEDQWKKLFNGFEVIR